MNIQQQGWSHESSFRSKQDLRHGFDQGRTNQSKKETPTAHVPTKKRPSFRSSPPDRKALDVAPIPFNSSAAPRHVPPQAPSARNVFLQRQRTPLSSSKPLSRPNRVEDLLNPTARDTTSASGHQHDGNGTNSRWTAPTAATSRPATPPSTVMRKRPSGDVSLPSITPALMNQYPHSLSRSTTLRLLTGHESHLITTGPSIATIDARQKPTLLPQDQASGLTELNPLLPSEIMTAPSMLDAAHPPSVPLPHPSPYVGTQFVRTGYPAPQNSSPPSALPQLASTEERQSHISTPFTSKGPASTLPQLAFDKEAFDVTTSEASRQSQYQILTFETEQGPIQVPIDVQAASKITDRKRKRNATASHRFRQRRKVQEQESSIKISGLKAQLWELTKEKDYYQRERDFLQNVVLQYRIPISTRPLSPRRRRHASLRGPQVADNETSVQTEDRNTLRRITTYLPQGQPPHMVTAHVPLSSDDMSASTKDPTTNAIPSCNTRLCQYQYL